MLVFLSAERESILALPDVKTHKTTTERERRRTDCLLPPAFLSVCPPVYLSVHLPVSAEGKKTRVVMLAVRPVNKSVGFHRGVRLLSAVYVHRLRTCLLSLAALVTGRVLCVACTSHACLSSSLSCFLCAAKYFAVSPRRSGKSFEKRKDLSGHLFEREAVSCLFFNIASISGGALLVKLPLQKLPLQHIHVARAPSTSVSSSDTQTACFF